MKRFDPMRLPLPLLLLLLLFQAQPATGQSAQTEVLLEELRSNAASVETIRSSFTQEKHLSVFNEVVVSEGVFLFRRPDNLRWEYLSPVRAGFVIQGDDGRRWNSVSGEKSLSADPMLHIVSEQILAWTTMDLGLLARQYEIQAVSTAPVVLRLTPRSEQLSQVLESLLITFAEDRSAVAEVRLNDPDGDYTNILFHDTKLNTPIPDGAF